MLPRPRSRACPARLEVKVRGPGSGARRGQDFCPRLSTKRAGWASHLRLIESKQYTASIYSIIIVSVKQHYDHLPLLILRGFVARHRSTVIRPRPHVTLLALDPHAGKLVSGSNMQPRLGSVYADYVSSSMQVKGCGACANKPSIASIGKPNSCRQVIPAVSLDLDRLESPEASILAHLCPLPLHRSPATLVDGTDSPVYTIPLISPPYSPPPTVAWGQPNIAIFTVIPRYTSTTMVESRGPQVAAVSPY